MWTGRLSIRRGGVVLERGQILATGSSSELRAQYPDATVHDYPGCFVMPGFIDAHVHYPQLGVIASFGRQLLDWLNDYTFPEEARFSDPDYCSNQAEVFVDHLLANGTTSAAVFSTVHPQSADELFKQAHLRGMRLMTGKVMMDRNCPEGLRDSAQSSYDDSRQLIKDWHGQGRLEYALTPRFAPTSTPEQLAVCQALWNESPTLALQTHLSENLDEIEWVRSLFPEAPDYLGVYEQFDLIRPRSLLGHAIHLTPREQASVLERGASLVHCPTSNLFLGSGLFDFQRLGQQGHHIALATDVGGGTSMSMLATMKAAYQVSVLKGAGIDIQALWYAATLGAARALGWRKIGNLMPGFEADLVVLDPSAHALLAQRVKRSETLDEAMFAMAILGDDRCVAATYVGGALQSVSSERA